MLIAQSADEGSNWSAPFILHTDGVPAEHGFVTLLPLDTGSMMAVWLDGRYTKGGHEGHEGQGSVSPAEAGGGAMTLRTATFDPAGALSDEAELDGRVCECCQTDAALSTAGPIVVYRDRSEDEIRDIYYTRRVEGRWSEPRPVFSDNWRIAACPVNGPAIAAAGELVAVAWFTGAQDSARVKVAFSRNGGATFDPPIRLDGGRPAGRVDVVLSGAGIATVSWLENRERGAEIRAVRVSPQGMLGPPLVLAATSESRRSGFPVLARAGEERLLAWTRVDSSGGTTVRVGKVLF